MRFVRNILKKENHKNHYKNMTVYRCIVILFASFLLASCGIKAPHDTMLPEGTMATSGDVAFEGIIGPQNTLVPESTLVPENTMAPENTMVPESPSILPEQDSIAEPELEEEGAYTSKEDVAYYLFLYGHLPSNFITKKDAEALGWPGGSLEPYAPGMCIGGNRFGNYEGLLPEKEGRYYTECDIDTLGADKRGAKRIVFSNDGLIYYTEDHYKTFELLYGEE